MIRAVLLILMVLGLAPALARGSGGGNSQIRQSPCLSDPKAPDCAAAR